MTSADHVCLLCMRETALPHQYPCPFCGGDDRTLTLQSPALPPRTVLDRRYVVGKTLGQGGFGITYQAYDLRMGNTVALKEYFPSSLVGRDSTVSTTVTVNAIKGTRALDEYASGLRHFLYEARRQAKLASSPGVVSVTDFFEYNNTAYYVMEFVDGDTLVKYIKNPQPMDQVLKLLEPISDSLISIHQAGLIHRDISPDNIMCAKNGQRKLLDFGASHSFTEEESTTGNATLKHGFAPPEQYGSSSMQGPWTDVYAFAATVYWCLTGKIPQDSMDRSIGGDNLRPPSELGAIIPPEAEAVLMRGMALPVTARYQDMDTFWTKLKKAASGTTERLNIPIRPSSPFSDPNGKTMVVSTIEEPEHTKVPEPVMESPASDASPSRSPIEPPEPTIQPEPPAQTGDLTPVSPPMEKPEHTKVPEPLPDAEPEPPVPLESPPVSDPNSASVQEPDITLYRPNLPEEPTASEDVPSPAEPSKTSVAAIAKPDNRLLIVLIGVIVTLLVVVAYMVVNPPHIPGLISSAKEDSVTISGTTYPIDTAELYLTSDPNYVSRHKPDATFTQISYLSKSDWNAICQLTKLRKLSLVGCNLSNLSGISNLTELEVLDLSDNDLSDLTELSELDTLMELYLADNALSDLSSLSPLTSLVYLDLSDNQISELTPLEGLTHLTTLYLQKNQLTDLSALSTMTNLSTLDIADNQLESLTPIYPLHDLKMLYVDGNSFTNSQLVSLCETLANCALDVDVLTNIPEEVTIGNKSYSTSLTELDLHSSGLRDGDIENLRYMVNLTWLDLSGNELSDFSSLSRLYGLTYLSLSHNQTADISFLSGLIHLEELYLSSNKITDLSPLSNLTKLESLAIGNNTIIDLSPVSNLTNLVTLAMCDFQADSLDPLYSLENLIEVRISKNTYSEESLSALKAAIPRCTINLY